MGFGRPHVTAKAQHNVLLSRAHFFATCSAQNKSLLIYRNSLAHIIVSSYIVDMMHLIFMQLQAHSVSSPQAPALLLTMVVVRPYAPRVLAWFASIYLRLMRLTFKRRYWGLLGNVLKEIKARGRALQ